MASQLFTSHKKSGWRSRVRLLLFWMASVFALARFFQLGDQLERIDWYFSLLFHISIVLPVTINLHWLMPLHLQKRRFVAYSFTLFAVWGMGIFVNEMVFDFLAEKIFPGYYFIAYLEFWEIALYIGFYLLLTSLIKLSGDWFKAENQRLEVEKRAKEQLDEELRALKAQINPHFLFNNLNLLYSQALRKVDGLPEHILQLSDLLRYVLYQTNSNKVHLADEIKMIEDYLALSRRRMREDASIHWHYEVDDEQVEIPPLLFLPLVENGMKYGIFEQTQPATLALQMLQKGTILQFSTSNALPEHPVKSGGVGLDNLRRRLQRLYPEAHRLEVRQEATNFHVTMELDLLRCVVQ